MSDDLHEPRARRYAEALATAAAAEQRINELVEQLADHEWHRSLAESQVSALRERLDLGDQQMIAVTDDPPGDEVAALIDLNNGRAWTRAKRHDNSDDPTYWVWAAPSQRGAVRYEWPLDTAGPLLALPYEWEFSAINREARARDEREDRIRERIRGIPGYPRDVFRAPLDDAVLAVVDALEKKNSETYSELFRVRNELDALKRATEAQKEDA